MNQESPTRAPSLYRFAFARLTVLTLTVLLLAGLVISIANDMYAFVKEDRSVTFTVSSPRSLPELTAMLDEGGVIKNPTVFRLYVRAKGRIETAERFSGTLELNEAMSYREILLALAEQNENKSN